MLKTVFEDDYLLVIDKPPGLVVTSTETQSISTLEDILKSEFKINLDRGGVVHRLDKDTSGLLVVAKTLPVLENLQSQFKERTIEKEYLSLVHGVIDQPGKIEAAIGRNPGDREKFVVFPKTHLEGETGESNDSLNAREAVTEYQPVGNFQFSIFNFQKVFEGFNKIQIRKLEKSHYNQFTFLKCHPLTGRTHQIRVHLKYLGHPIVGDQKYAGRKTSRLDQRWCPRQFLHAARLSFIHPETRQKMEFESRLPEDLQTVLGKLETIKD